MALNILQLVFRNFALLVIFVNVARAAELAPFQAGLDALNVTTSLDDYINQYSRQIQSLIAGDEAATAEFRAGYERQLLAVDAHKFFLESELFAVDQKLYPLEFLNEISKHCVQKYRSLLYSVAAIRTSYASCLSSARSNIGSILVSADSNVRSLNNLYNTNFKNGILDCERRNNNSYENRTICSVNLISSLSVNINTLQRSFLTSMDTARCSADTRVRQTVECTFRPINATLTSIGATTQLINSCIEGLELCESCRNNTIVVQQTDCSNATLSAR